jgi:putative tricarboxylic transport membrane protein
MLFMAASQSLYTRCTSPRRERRPARLVAARRHPDGAPTDNRVVFDPMGSRGWERIKAGSVPGVFLLLAAWICFEALQVPLGSFRMPGAGFFPLALGLALGALSVMLLGLGLLSPASGSTDAWPERRVGFYLVASIVAAVWLFEHAGFLLTMTLFLALTTRVLGKISWLTAVVLAVAGSAAAYVVFSRVLLIALPSGILPF